jgi:hypothetical protein
MYDDREWVTPQTAARRMGITLAQLDVLIRRGGVRARRTGWTVEINGVERPDMEVEPCIVNAPDVTPEEPAPKPHTGVTKRRPHTPVRGRK